MWSPPEMRTWHSLCYRQMFHVSIIAYEFYPTYLSNSSSLPSINCGFLVSSTTHFILTFPSLVYRSPLSFCVCQQLTLHMHPSAWNPSSHMTWMWWDFIVVDLLTRETCVSVSSPVICHIPSPVNSYNQLLSMSSKLTISFMPWWVIYVSLKWLLFILPPTQMPLLLWSLICTYWQITLVLWNLSKHLCCLLYTVHPSGVKEWQCF